jgi:hypothetical protein
MVISLEVSFKAMATYSTNSQDRGMIAELI